MSDAGDPVQLLNEAMAFDADGVIHGPLDLIGWIAPAAGVNSNAREWLWGRLFLEAPLPYWQLVPWARRLNDRRLAEVLLRTQSPGWEATAVKRSPRDRAAVVAAVASRFDEFDADLYPWDDGPQGQPAPQRLKYELGRELARSYLIGDERGWGPEGLEARARLLAAHRPAWDEWVTLNEASGYAAPDIAEATTRALDNVVGRDVTAGLNGIGRTHILLEQTNVNNSPSAGMVTASLLPLDARQGRLDGMVVPDLRENGLLSIGADFLAGVQAAWRYSRSRLVVRRPVMLCFSVRPTVASVVQQLSGRSAEVAVLAAIESAIARRVLRPDAAASATLALDDEAARLHDPPMGPASFEEKKFSAAINQQLTRVVVHPEIAQQWRLTNESLRTETLAGAPDVVPSEFFRSDALPQLETRSLWKLALTVPAGVSLVFAGMALFWQLYKGAASPPASEVVEPLARLPLVLPGLVAVEMGCLMICLLILLYCGRSIAGSLDSARAAWAAFGLCAVVVLTAQFAPVGVRYEGLLDNPLYSVLFGEPQLTSASVIGAGGGGLLAMHTLSQTVGFLTTLYGVSAFVIRLIQTRAHTEPIYEDRCELIHEDWLFGLAMMGAFLSVVLSFGLVRNTLWYYYLTTLPGVWLIDRQGSMVEVVAPLIGICLVLMLSVGMVWIVTLHAYLSRVIKTSRGRSGYTSRDVVARLPRPARLLYLLRPVG